MCTAARLLAGCPASRVRDRYDMLPVALASIWQAARVQAARVHVTNRTACARTNFAADCVGVNEIRAVVRYPKHHCGSCLQACNVLAGQQRCFRVRFRRMQVRRDFAPFEVWPFVVTRSRAGRVLNDERASQRIRAAVQRVQQLRNEGWLCGGSSGGGWTPVRCSLRVPTWAKVLVRVVARQVCTRVTFYLSRIELRVFNPGPDLLLNSKSYVRCPDMRGGTRI
jgi:hypothetical protein